MNRSITIAMFLVLWLLGVRSSAQDQSPPAPASPPNQSQTPGTPPANAPTPVSHSTAKKPGTKVSRAVHKKVVVRNGGARDESAQLAPGMTAEQEQRNREATTRLLDTTDANLKSIAGRPLTPAQQSQLDEIRTYMRQSKDASDSGDLARAHTLAYKAHLLSDELRK